MKKFANISGVYLILSLASLFLMILSLFRVIDFSSMVIDALRITRVENVIGDAVLVIYMTVTALIMLSSIILLLVGFDLRKKFKNNNEQLQNVQRGIYVNIFHATMILLLILYSIRGAHLD